MAEILFSVFLILLLIAGMAIGVIAGRKPLQGSCGGLGALGLKGECEICGGDLSRCESATEQQDKSELAYRVGE